MLKKIFKFVPGTALPMVINFFLTILYACMLEPGEYGILNIYLNSIQIVYALSASIFQTASLRYYSIRGAYDDENDFISSFIFANLITTLLLIPFALIVNLFIKFDWWIIVLSIGTNGLYQFICNLFRLQNNPLKYNSVRCVSAFLSVILLLFFSYIVAPLTYVWPIAAVYGSYGLTAFIEILKIRHNVHVRSISLSLLKQSIKYGLPLIGVSVLGYVIASCDQYFLLHFLGNEAVGNYALGHRLVEALIVNLLMMILTVMTPELNKQHDLYGAFQSGSLLKKMINSAVWIILPLSFAIIVYADYIVRLFFSLYTSASHIMQLVVFASMFHGISMFVCKGLELVKQTKYIFIGLLIATAINCIYNAVFIPVYGIDASAHSSLISYVIYNVLLVLFSKGKYKMSFDIKYALKTCFATALTILSAILLMRAFCINNTITLILEVAVCVVIYLFISFLLKLLEVFK